MRYTITSTYNPQTEQVEHVLLDTETGRTWFYNEKAGSNSQGKWNWKPVSSSDHDGELDRPTP